MYFNAVNGCQRCTVIGKRSSISNAVVFTKLNQAPRTDELFRAGAYMDEHQKCSTPLTNLIGLDMIKDFVIADSLHLLELGVMKRLLNGWRGAKRMNCLTWSYEIQSIISDHIKGIKLPCEINRHCRSLTFFAVWKGQEFRTFLLYYGPIVLREHLHQHNYNNFMKFYCAVRMASSHWFYRTHLRTIRRFFDDFIIEFKELYGSHFLTSNFHNLTHVAADVERFGTLPTISAYPFESYLGQMKRIIRAGKDPLKQIANRFTERLGIADYNYKPNETFPNENIIKTTVYNKVTTISIKIQNDYSLSTAFADKWFLYIHNNEKTIMWMSNASTISGEYFITAHALNAWDNFFNHPIDSSLLHIYVADISKHNSTPVLIPIKNIACKFVALQKNVYKNADTNIPEQNLYIFIPLLHTETKYK